MKNKLTLGPVFFNWPAEKLRDFYFRIADEADVDMVYVGEVVCSKRSAFFAPHLAEVIERLQSAGKDVVHSTLALIMNKREMDAVRDMASCEDFFIEANDIAACALMDGRGHAVGPFINVYNEGTLAYLAEMGAQRICLPPELPSSSLSLLADAAQGFKTECKTELEVMVFGRLPLAISARCYHARAHNLAKDSCQYVCDRDANGMEVDTVDGAPFLAVNGTQTLSYTYCSLVGELEALKSMGIRSFRLSPHDLDMVAVARIFRDVLEHHETPKEAEDKLQKLAAGATFANGYFHGREGAGKIVTD